MFEAICAHEREIEESRIRSMIINCEKTQKLGFNGEGRKREFRNSIRLFTCAPLRVLKSIGRSLNTSWAKHFSDLTTRLRLRFVRRIFS